VAKAQEHQERLNKREAKAKDKNDSAGKKQMRDTTKNYVRGSNREAAEDDLYD